MMRGIGDYFSTLSERFGEGWNRFWFPPSDGCTISTIRVLTGLLALYWFATLTPDLGRFYGAEGWLPMESVRQVDVDNMVNTGVSPPTYLAFVRGERELQIAHAIGFVVLLMFAAGLFTRVSTILATIVVLS